MFLHLTQVKLVSHDNSAAISRMSSFVAPFTLVPLALWAVLWIETKKYATDMSDSSAFKTYLRTVPLIMLSAKTSFAFSLLFLYTVFGEVTFFPTFVAQII